MQDWKGDAEYHAAVGRSWLTAVFGLGCCLVLACAVFACVLGFVGLSDVLSVVAD